MQILNKFYNFYKKFFFGCVISEKHCTSITFLSKLFDRTSPANFLTNVLDLTVFFNQTFEVLSCFFHKGADLKIFMCGEF